MNITLEIFLFIFFALFLLVGGVQLGLGIKMLFAGKASLGAIVTGGLFAGAALLVSAFFYYPNRRFDFGLEAGILLLAIVGTIFLPRARIEEIGVGTLIAVGFGGLVAMMGGLILVQAFQQSEVLFGVLLGGCWTFVGGMFFLNGIVALLRGTALGTRVRRAGEIEILPEEELTRAAREAKKKKRA
ncbi:MAG: hypothetical protein HY070_00865 [Chloroflexi bacterium]|nr:hypothetical protein [Chloroflexota bacterium]MBI3741077.1 hypothetical protein [Chloroflexota bacterium]